MIAKIENGSIVLESSGSGSFDDLARALPEDQPRYIFVNVNFTSPYGHYVNKDVLITYSPDTADMSSKFQYINNSNRLGEKINHHKDFIINDKLDMTLDEMKSRLS